MTDAISKAIGALEYAATMLDEDRYPGRITEAIAALQALQGEAEPVAWMVTTERYGKPHTYPVTGDYDNVVNQCDYGNPVPLYTAPQPVVPAAKVWNQAEGRDGKLYTDGWNDCRDAMLSPAKVSDPRHQWDDGGERCVKCGDKDWFAGAVCDESKLLSAAKGEAE